LIDPSVNLWFMDVARRYLAMAMKNTETPTYS